MADQIISRAEAKAQGLLHYFTGKNCKNSHVSIRFTSNGACNGCLKMRDVPSGKRRAKHRRRYLKHNKKIKAERKMQYRLNPERYISRVSARYHKNLEISRSRSKELRPRYKDKISKYNLSYYQANAENFRFKSREWHRLNPERASSQRSLRRAREKKAEGFYTADEILALFKKQRGKCAYCFCSIKKGYHADHMIPLVCGGSNWISNIALSCARCNLSKHTKDPIDFARSIGNLL